MPLSRAGPEGAAAGRGYSLENLRRCLAQVAALFAPG